MVHKRLIVFTRYPEAGKVKTRLIPALGEQDAADLSRRMTEYTLARVGEACAVEDAQLEVRFVGGDESSMRAWLGPGIDLKGQGEGDLGVRMRRAFGNAFRGGARRVLIVGTDCPQLDGHVIRHAFSTLESSDVVLGPANDGGYYLIGLARDVPELFAGIRWGTEEVFDRTMEIVSKLGISPHLLPSLSDVDRPEDLHLWTGPSISVVIPTLDEEKNLPAALERARDDDAEIIVADGGSTDGTLDIARSRGANVVLAPAGRAQQMNAGAREAHGRVLIFLHADTLLPRDYASKVRAVLHDPGIAMGAFAFRFDGAGFILRLLERTTNFRSRRMRMPYGDQALFLRADAFREVGGFSNMPFMEDFEFVRRMRKKGRIVTLPAPIRTSSRRYEERGPIRTALLNQLIIAGYCLGISPKRLARWYH